MLLFNNIQDEESQCILHVLRDYFKCIFCKMFFVVVVYSSKIEIRFI